jgi:hypothetical protein
MLVKVISSIKRAVCAFWVAFVLFLVSALLFLAVLVPAALHRLPVAAMWPQVLVLKGSVSRFAGGEHESEPLSAAIIEIGGYRTSTDANGSFDLRFSSQTLVDIPVIIRFDEGLFVRSVSFKPGEIERHESFVLK